MNSEELPSNPSASHTRRQFVGGLTTGLAALAAVPALAQEKNAAASAAPALQDPLTKYPYPPFKTQAQPFPGIAGKMEPKPDHGEKSYKGSGRLKGRKAFVTGGDSGIGRAAAIAFAREGADVAIGYLPAEDADAQEVLQLIREAGGEAVGLPGDIRTEEVCQKLIADAVQQLGGLDILVNNAGRQQAVDSILLLSTEQFDATFKTNVYAPFWLTKAALPHLKPGSAIINTASEQAYNPSPNLLDYAQTKATNVNFTKSLAKQLASKGIRVNAVAPGPYWTALQVSGGANEEKLVTFGQDTPMGRPGQPAEIAPLYVLLASSENSYATGQVWGASGGHGNP